MIGDLQVIDGYASKLPRLKEPITFKPGLNVLFGPNGCGKSTTLKIIAAYCSIRGAGWSAHQAPGDMFPLSYGKKKYDCSLPYSYHRLAPGKCKAKMEWDGTASILADATVSDNTSWTHLFYDKSDSPDGMDDVKEQLGVMYGKPSAGQLRLHKLARYYEAAKKPPQLNVVPAKYKNYNSSWTNCFKKQAEYIGGLPRGGPVTFLMDEPDRSLSIEVQAGFWKNFIPRVAKDFQVIIATHSIFALMHTDANWIEFEEDYVHKSRKALEVLS